MSQLTPTSTAFSTQALQRAVTAGLADGILEPKEKALLTLLFGQPSFTAGLAAIPATVPRTRVGTSTSP